MPVQDIQTVTVGTTVRIATPADGEFGAHFLQHFLETGFFSFQASLQRAATEF